jgi:hypothetical protein
MMTPSSAGVNGNPRRGRISAYFCGKNAGKMALIRFASKGEIA